MSRNSSLTFSSAVTIFPPQKKKAVSFKKRLKYGCSGRGTSLLITKGIRKMVKLSVSVHVLSLNGMERKKMDFFTLTSIMDYFWIPNVDLYEYYSFSVLSSFNPIFNPLSSITHPSYMQVCFLQQHLYPPPPPSLFFQIRSCKSWTSV